MHILYTRKLCGFYGYQAKNGYSKCLKAFDGSIGNLNYSGFDRTIWTPRNYTIHYAQNEKTLKARMESVTLNCYDCRI